MVARGGARKGAGHRLSFSWSVPHSHPFVVLHSYFADSVPSSDIDLPLRRLPDPFDVRPFQPGASVLLACSFVLCSPQSQTRETLAFSVSMFFSSALAPTPPPPPKFGTRLRPPSPDTSSARGFSYPLSIVILLSVASSARLTLISTRTWTTGTEPSTFLTESRDRPSLLAPDQNSPRSVGV